MCPRGAHKYIRPVHSPSKKCLVPSDCAESPSPLSSRISPRQHLFVYFDIRYVSLPLADKGPSLSDRPSQGPLKHNGCRIHIQSRQFHPSRLSYELDHKAWRISTWQDQVLGLSMRHLRLLRLLHSQLVCCHVNWTRWTREAVQELCWGKK